MNPRRLIRILALSAVAFWSLAAASSAAAAPVWNLNIQHYETNFVPGASGPTSPEYRLNLENVGSDASSGPVTLTMTLPPGLTRREVRNQYTNSFGAVWSCPGSPGNTTVTCVTSTAIPRHTVAAGLVIAVNVDPAASGTLVASATVSGGGGAAVSAQEPTQISSQPAGFGVVPDSFQSDFVKADGITPEREAGSHPELFTVSFDLNTIATPYHNPNPGSEDTPEYKSPKEALRDLDVALPPGFVGYPAAVGECQPAQLTASACPLSSQVGRVDLTTTPTAIEKGFTFSKLAAGVFNMAPPKGFASDLAFQVADNPVHLRISLDPSRGYALKSELRGANETLGLFSQKMTLWGIPADPSHDSERCEGFKSSDTTHECPAGIAPKPFLTLPWQCGAQTASVLSGYDSWENQGVFGPPVEYQPDGAITGCDQAPFAPTVSVAPTTNAADSPAGLDVGIDLPQHEACEEVENAASETEVRCERATSPLRDATVALPRGLTVNPAGANGLQACAEAQISLGTNDPVTCPNPARIGTAKVTTPLLPEPLEGVVYLATPYHNPFGTLLAGYIVLDDPARGILIKLPGRIDVDPTTGQLSGSFDENPELPFSRLQLHFKEGAHSTLMTPQGCGSYASTSDLVPWSGSAAVHPGASFTIDKGQGGGACPSALPNSPSFDAGPISPVSHAYSPFVLHLHREDGTQRFGAFDVNLPPGLVAMLAGTGLCPEAALAAAETHTGSAEQANPSCPASSHLGSVIAGAGAGPSPYYVHGDAYLTGPYKGAPLSLAVITPAVAGPFDLGTIVIRAALRIDPTTAQVTAVSDPIPTMLKGIPTDIRSVDVDLDRPQFTLTGTSCNPFQVSGELTSTVGQEAPLSTPYQLSDCGRLPFRPRISLSLRGATGRTGHPGLTAVLRPRPGDANIGHASVVLPHSEFLAQDHIRTICTRVQFAAKACPKGSIYGYATAVTPLLDEPLRGPVYLRSSDHELPDLVADLNGRFEITLDGRIDSKNKRIRTTFAVVPDAPVTRFTLKMQGGKKGLLENSRDICRHAGRVLVKMVAHNGKTSLIKPRLKARCHRHRRVGGA